jgi:hypothetical protein
MEKGIKTLPNRVADSTEHGAGLVRDDTSFPPGATIASLDEAALFVVRARDLDSREWLGSCQGNFVTLTSEIAQCNNRNPTSAAGKPRPARGHWTPGARMLIHHTTSSQGTPAPGLGTRPMSAARQAPAAAAGRERRSGSCGNRAASHRPSWPPRSESSSPISAAWRRVSTRSAWRISSGSSRSSASTSASSFGSALARGTTARRRSSGAGGG